MPARPVASEAQWEMLLQCMQEHPAMARGSYANETPLVKKTTNDQWRALASRLSSVPGATKTPDKWRDYWNNTKYAARKKASARRQQDQASHMDAGPMPKKLVLTDREEQILALIGRGGGVNHCEESVRIPFDLDETQTTTPSVSPQKSSTTLQKPSVLTQKPFESSLPTIQLHSPPAAQAPTLLSNPHFSSSIGSPQTISASRSSMSDFIEQTQRVAVVDSNMSRIPLEDLNRIQNQLQKNLWDYMIDTSTASQPIFENCSVLEPFGLIFKCCNQDAVVWLTNRIKDITFTGHNLVVILNDLESKLPKTVNLCVNIITDYSHTNKNIESVFKVLVRTNQSWLNTPQWMLLHDKCVSVTSFNPSDGTALCVVFSVLLNDIKRLREGQFKLHFLFGVVPVDYYEESKIEIIESQVDQ